jgi:hypothetical protein
VVPLTDFADGDGGISVAVLSKTHLHPPSCTRGVRLSAPQRLTISHQSGSRRNAVREVQTEAVTSSNLIFVLRC